MAVGFPPEDLAREEEESLERAESAGLPGARCCTAATYIRTDYTVHAL